MFAQAASLGSPILFWPFIVKPKVSKSDQSRITQEKQRTNQNSRQKHASHAEGGKMCDRRQGWEKKNTQAILNLEPWLVEKGFNLIGYNISYTEKRAYRQKCSPHNRNITNKEEIWGWFSQTSMLVVSGWSHSLPEAAGRQISWKLQSIVRPTIDVFNLKIKWTLISLSLSVYKIPTSQSYQTSLPAYLHFGGGLWLQAQAARRNPAILKFKTRIYNSLPLSPKIPLELNTSFYQSLN